MTFEVRISPGDRRFGAEPGQSLLDSALRAGIAVPYGCSDGRCGDCKARVLSGSVERVRPHDYVLGAADKASGCMLMCACAATSDLLLEVAHARTHAELPQQRVPAKVEAATELRPGLLALDLKIQRGRVFRFFAGQRAALSPASSGARDAVQLPVASCPCDGTRLRFFVQQGAGPAWLDALARPGGGRAPRLEVAGPGGDFVLDEASRRPLLFVCYDAAFAPVQSLVEHAMNLEMEQAMHLYRIAPAGETHFLDNLCRSWADAWDGLRYRRLSLGGAPEPAALDETARAVAADCPEVAACDAYLCAPPALADALAARLVDAGLPRERIRVDTAYRF